MLGPEYPELAHAIPNDHARIASAETMLDETLAARPDRAGLRVLDLGCGDGRALDMLRPRLPGLRYSGLDIERSPEVDSRTRSDAEFRSYDGRTLPYDDESFDIVYSRQVFEHVRHPDAVTAEVRRVLVPGGVFLGSMSNLEPYHSFSIFNYTPYGVFRLLTDNGLEVTTLRPGPESTSLTVRQLTMRRISGFRVIYPAIALAARLRGWDARRANYLKLRFSGHICFSATRPA